MNELEWEVLLVVLYPIIFDALCLIMVINRIDSAVRVGHGAKPNFDLSVLHSYAISGRTILPSLTVILFVVFLDVCCARGCEKTLHQMKRLLSIPPMIIIILMC